MIEYQVECCLMFSTLLYKARRHVAILCEIAVPESLVTYAFLQLMMWKMVRRTIFLQYWAALTEVDLVGLVAHAVQVNGIMMNSITYSWLWLHVHTWPWQTSIRLYFKVVLWAKITVVRSALGIESESNKSYKVYGIIWKFPRVLDRLTI